MSDDIVVSVHAPTVPEISIESDATGSICAGTNVNFLATITSGGTAPVFEWRVNNIPSGINDDSFSSTTLTNGSVITCRLISNETCAISTPVTSNTVVISVMELVSPQVTIDIEMLGTACTGNAANFVAQTVNCGTTTNYQWRKNGNPFGPNSASFTSGAFNSGDSFTCAITTNTNCAASTSAISNSLTLAVQGPGTYYLDADGDGFGDNSTAIAACTAPFGYVSIGNDCDDDNMDVNPGVDEWPNDIDDNCDSEIDEEGVLYTYYLDQDDDGYGDSNNSIQEFYLIPGYVTVGGDCNDGDFSVHPFAVEICSNGIDEDCDGSIDEACTPLNDDKEFSFILPISPNGDCWTYDGTLSNASVSTEAHSTCISGNDVWYHFGAPEPGISLQVISEHDDVLLELQDENGNTLDVENSVSGIGVEILNYNQLVAGESYWLIVRNYNTAVGTGGAFSVCGNVLFDTRVTNGNTVNASMCTLIACQPVNAENYIFRFQESVSNNTISYTSSIPTINLSVIPGLVYGTTYSVTVDALYQRSNGAGVMENLLISGTSSAILNLTQHKLLSVANSFACPNVVTPGTVISTQGFVCAAEGYDWEIVQIAPVALGAVVIYSETGNFFNLMNIPGIAPGSAYQIRVRPVFAGGIRGSYGEQKCIQVIEYSNMNEPEIATAASDLEPQIDFVPYPNPSRDGELNINSTGLDGKPARITIRSITGQHIHSESFAAISESFSIELPQQLAVGMYLITIETTEEKSITKHWMIEN
jgi:hypothetical protein